MCWPAALSRFEVYIRHCSCRSSRPRGSRHPTKRSFSTNLPDPWNFLLQKSGVHVSELVHRNCAFQSVCLSFHRSTSILHHKLFFRPVLSSWQPNCSATCLSINESRTYWIAQAVCRQMWWFHVCSTCPRPSAKASTSLQEICNDGRLLQFFDFLLSLIWLSDRWYIYVFIPSSQLPCLTQHLVGVRSLIYPSSDTYRWWTFLLFLFNVVPIVDLDGSRLFRSMEAQPFNACLWPRSISVRIHTNQPLEEDGIGTSRFPHCIRHHSSLDSNILSISLNDT